MKSKAEDIKIGVIGCGYWGKNLIRVFDEIGNLSCIYDENMSTANFYKEKYNVPVLNYDELIESDEIDGVVISTPAVTHSKIAIDAINHGKHVFIEKPMAINVEDAKKILNAAGDHDRKVMVGHILQYHPAYQKIKEIIAEGVIGKLQYVYSNRLNFGKIRQEENILWSFAPHDISMILGLVGSEPKNVDSTGTYSINENVADVTVTHLAFDNNINAHIFVSWLHPYKEQKMIIIGDNGMIVFDDQNDFNDKVILYKHSLEWDKGMPIPNKSEGIAIEIESSEPLKNECIHFIDVIAGKNVTSKTNGEEGLRVLNVLEKAQKRLDENKK